MQEAASPSLWLAACAGQERTPAPVKEQHGAGEPGRAQPGWAQPGRAQPGLASGFALLLTPAPIKDRISFSLPGTVDSHTLDTGMRLQFIYFTSLY